MTSLLTAIRDRLTSKRIEEKQTRSLEYLDLVRMIADGEEPPFEALEAVIVEKIAVFRALCPTTPNHTEIAVVRRTGVTRLCKCNQCGAEWSQEFAGPDSAEIGPQPGPSIEDLERDVELLRKRREWRRELDDLPRIEKTLRELNARQEAVMSEFKAALEKKDSQTLSIHEERISMAYRKECAETAANNLRKTCMNPVLKDRIQQLTAERNKAGRRAADLKDDLFGVGPIGIVDGPSHQSTGAELYRYQLQLLDTKSFFQEMRNLPDPFQRFALLNPDHPVFQNCRKATQTPKKKRDENLATEAQYRHFYSSQLKPKLDELHEQTQAQEKFEKQIDQLKKSALDP